MQHTYIILHMLQNKGDNKENDCQNPYKKREEWKKKKEEIL